MASLDSLKVKSLLAKGVIVQNSGIDTPTVFKMRYIGTGSVTSVTVTTGTNIVLVTTDGLTDTYAFATYTTIGALTDAINGDGIFEVKVLDALRSATSATRLLDGEVISVVDEDLKTTVWNVKLDTSTGLQYAVCLSPNRVFDSPKAHSVKIQEIEYAIVMGTAATDSFQIYKRNNGVETKIYSALSVKTTDTKVNWASGLAGITGTDGDEFVVIVKDAATMADLASNYIQVVGQIL